MFSISRAVFSLALIQPLAICWAADPSGPELNCSPKQIHLGEKLNITGLPDDHKGWTFTVAGTNDHVTYLVSSVNRKSNKFPVPISAETFGKLKKITLDVSTAKGIPFDSGKVQGPPKPIFEKSGEYEISVGAPLGAEDTDTYACKVQFSAAPASSKKNSGQPSKSEPVTQ